VAVLLQKPQVRPRRAWIQEKTGFSERRADVIALLLSKDNIGVGLCRLEFILLKALIYQQQSKVSQWRDRVQIDRARHDEACAKADQVHEMP
jgi:hypothetical protein